MITDKQEVRMENKKTTKKEQAEMAYDIIKEEVSIKQSAIYAGKSVKTLAGAIWNGFKGFGRFTRKISKQAAVKTGSVLGKVADKMIDIGAR